MWQTAGDCWAKRLIKNLLLSGRGDLNPRPLRPERSALPNCATSRCRILQGALFQTSCGLSTASS
jgi:hypothetical protein